MPRNDLTNAKGQALCGAKKRSGPGYCTRPVAEAGKRCRFHGAKAGGPIKHGLYSKKLSALTEAQAERIAELRSREPLDVLDDIIRASLAREAIPMPTVSDTPNPANLAVAEFHVKSSKDMVSMKIAAMKSEAIRTLLMQRIRPYMEQFAARVTRAAEAQLPAEKRDSFRTRLERDLSRLIDASEAEIVQEMDRE